MLITKESSSEKTLGNIAITGISGRFPGSKNLNEFWENIKKGIETVSALKNNEIEMVGADASLIDNSDFIKAASILDDIESFDAGLFGFEETEAQIMDPQIRLFLECAWEGLENAGYKSADKNKKIGVFAGCGISSYLINNLLFNPQVLMSKSHYELLLANDKDALTAYTSCKLGLKGPSINVQSGGSTALVSVHLACESLKNRESDICLAGGVSVNVPQKTGYLYHQNAIFSKQGQCRAFDADADGTVPGSGAGVIVLKRLEDAIADRDNIYAVIKGSAVNHSGAWSEDFSKPSLEGQLDVISKALSVSGIDPSTISYVEANGIGLPDYDSVEINALAKAFNELTSKKSYCAVGSVKSNIGYLNAAAGMDGLIKLIFMLKDRQIPPIVNFDCPNPLIDFNGPFYINKELSPWENYEKPLRASINSYDVRGTNVHIILEEAPKAGIIKKESRDSLLTISARSKEALEKMTENLACYIKENPHEGLENIAYTLQTGRKNFDYRRILVGNDSLMAADHLVSKPDNGEYKDGFVETDPKVVFSFFNDCCLDTESISLFYENMPLFRHQIDRCADIIKQLTKFDIHRGLFAASDKTDGQDKISNQILLDELTLFAVGYSMAQTYISLGVEPHLMLGYSLCEYICACLADVISLEDVLKLLVSKDELLQQIPQAKMITVSLPEEELNSIVGKGLFISSVDGPETCTLTGNLFAVDVLQNELSTKGISYNVHNTRSAMHCKIVEPVLESYKKKLQSIQLRQPVRRYLSCVTGEVVGQEAMDTDYWVNHMKEKLRFDKSVRKAADEGTVILDIFLGGSLDKILCQNVAENKPSFLTIIQRDPEGQKCRWGTFLEVLGQLWLKGVEINWDGLYKAEEMRRVPLPTYPFERKHCWISPKTGFIQSDEKVPQINKDLQIPRDDDTHNHTEKTYYPRPRLSTEYVEPDTDIEIELASIWQDLLGIETIGVNDNFIELGGNSIIATQILNRMKEKFPVELPIGTLLKLPTIAMQAKAIDQKLLEIIQGFDDDELGKLL